MVRYNKATEKQPPYGVRYQEAIELLQETVPWDERWRMANNPATPQEILEVLSYDRNLSIAEEALLNPTLTSEFLLEFLQGLPKDSRLRGTLAQRPQATPELLEQLYDEDKDSSLS